MLQQIRASIKKIENSGKTHAHKIQAAIAMEQRAKVMEKQQRLAVYRNYIEKMKKKTKEMNKESTTFRKFSEKTEAVVFTFGRFNPPTTGHEKLIQKVAKVEGVMIFIYFHLTHKKSKERPIIIC